MRASSTFLGCVVAVLIVAVAAATATATVALPLRMDAVISEHQLHDNIAAADGVTGAAATIGLFCADDGKFSGMSELHYIMQQLVNATNASLPECGSVTLGAVKVAGRAAAVPVIAVTTGIGSLNSLICTAAVMRKYGQIRKIVYSGTSGWTPFLGGLDPTKPGGCDALPPAGGGARSARFGVGSVCFTATAAKYACGFCTQRDDIASVNECSRPNCSGRDRADVFGKCTFSADRGLVRELRRAAAAAPLPAMPATLVALQQAWWIASGYPASARAPVAAYPDHCAEFDMQQILSSAPADYLCREYLAAITNRQPPNERHGAGNVTAADVACVSAMEAAGVLRALEALPPAARPQVAIVRGMSNADFAPLRRVPWPPGQAPSPAVPRWQQDTAYLPAAQAAQASLEGYHYSILTTNVAVLRWLATQ